MVRSLKDISIVYSVGAVDDGREDEEVVGDADVPTGSDEEVAVCSAMGSVYFQFKISPEERD